jgi:hypothetical protein
MAWVGGKAFFVLLLSFAAIQLCTAKEDESVPQVSPGLLHGSHNKLFCSEKLL